jgi:hypothetical protein
VVEGAFRQKDMNALLLELVTSDKKQDWHNHCLHYADTHDLGRRPEVVAHILTEIATGKQGGE